MSMIGLGSRRADNRPCIGVQHAPPRPSRTRVFRRRSYADPDDVVGCGLTREMQTHGLDISQACQSPRANRAWNTRPLRGPAHAHGTRSRLRVVPGHTVRHPQLLDGTCARSLRHRAGGPTENLVRSRNHVGVRRSACAARPDRGRTRLTRPTPLAWGSLRSIGPGVGSRSWRWASRGVMEHGTQSHGTAGAGYSVGAFGPIKLAWRREREPMTHGARTGRRSA
jgi:hypothetical protein